MYVQSAFALPLNICGQSCGPKPVQRYHSVS